MPQTPLTGTYNGEDIVVQFSATGEYERDQGGMDVTDITIDWVEICGLRVQLRDLPQPLRNVLHSLGDEVEFQ